MKAFQRARIIDARFARATPQDPLLEITSQFAHAFAAAKQAAELPEVAEVPANVAAEPVTRPLLADAVIPATIQVDPSPAAANPRRRTIKRSARRRTIASVRPNRPVTSFERHQRKCVICKHRNRVEIEEDFVNWIHPDDIATTYHLDDFRGLYRHAHVTGLMQTRSMNVRFAAESILEHSGAVVPSADAVLRAVKICTRINNRGEWHNPPSHVIVSSGSQVNVNVLNPPAVQQLRTAGELELPSVSSSQEISNRQMTELEIQPK